MKKYCIIILLFLFVACDLVFHEPNNPFLDIDTEQEKIDMVNGIYSRLSRVHNEDYFLVLSRSDDVNTYGNYDFSGSGVSCSSSGYKIDYPEVIGNIYLNLYKAIININRLLSVISINEEPALAGELYFLRSYSYFKLARLFGTPPIILDTEVNYLVEKPDYTEVYNLIEENMLNALDLLPETYTLARIPGETPHKGTAKAMLAEIYLNMGGFPLYDKSKYSESARLAKEVIDSCDYYNFHLLDDFAELWQCANQTNSENIFGIFYNGETSELSNSISGKIHVSDTHWLVFNSVYHPNFHFFVNFPFNYRKYTSFQLGVYHNMFFNYLETLEPGIDVYMYDPLTIGGRCEYVRSLGSLKWTNDQISYYNTGMINKPAQTLFLLRYAQTLLTYAEAKARTGGVDATSLELVNQIRRRANKVNLYTPSEFDLPTNLTSEQFLDSVVWERAWELAMEPDGRWFDIVRLELKEEIEAAMLPIDQNTVVAPKYLTDDWYFNKIPQEDRWLNPNYED